MGCVSAGSGQGECSEIAGYFSLLLASSRGVNNSISRSPGNTGVCEKQRKPPAFAQVLSWLGPGCGLLSPSRREMGTSPQWRKSCLSMDK